TDEYRNYPVNLGLTGDSDYPYKAYIDFVNNQVDPTTGTLQVRAVINNPKPAQGPREFIPGMFLRVQVTIGDAHPALLIPKEVIGTDESQKYVYILNAENKVERRPIKTGEVQSNHLQVAIPEMIVMETGGGFHIAKEGEKGVESLTKDDRIVNGGLQK